MGLFDKVEKGLERSVNRAFAKAFRSEVQPVEIASAIRRAMDDKAAAMGPGRTMVPNRYTIVLSPTDFARLDEYSAAVTQDLIAAAQEHAETQRYTPGGPIQIQLTTGDELETGVFQVRTAASKVGDVAGAPSPYAAPAAPTPDAPAPGPVAPAPTAAPGAVNPAKRPWLDIDGERYPLLGSLTVIGRDGSADVVVDDPGISRRHSEIRITNDGPHLVCSIRDLASTNGTFVNGERVLASSRLEDGDRLTVGRTSLVFRAGKR